MTAIILQCRLDSTRLPRKALLDLAGKPVIARVMENLRRVPADRYVLACDVASEESLRPIAEREGFECIGGPKDDVLARYCLVVSRLGADVVLRATGDNPWLFADAAAASLARFAALSASGKWPDYFTYTGLPHGCGIEVMAARSLLEASVLTDSAYDHEHVGPALYNHQDRFRCVLEPAPAEWYQPELRTTIDTREDYDRACLMAGYLADKGLPLPATSAQVADAWRYVSRPILFVPSAVAGQGTGHLVRVCALAASLQAQSWRCLIYVPPASPLIGFVPDTLTSLVVDSLPEAAHLVVVDNFRTGGTLLRQLRRVGPIVALDEGGAHRAEADYLIDVIPGLPGRLCPANVADAAFLPLPRHRKAAARAEIRSVLVVAGGENKAGLALPVAKLLARHDYEVTVIDPSAVGIARADDGLTVSGPVPGLRETLCHYDLVITHYGFTAFEAIAAGCKVLLFSPDRYHYRLGVVNGFSTLPPGLPSASRLRAAMTGGFRVPHAISPATEQRDLSAELLSLVDRAALSCPLCGSAHRRVVYRSPERTVGVCLDCGMLYQSFLTVPVSAYGKSYFFEEYRAQYGKTYLEDFDSIKKQGFRRLEIIDRIHASKRPARAAGERRLLDIGCAYGPFLKAASENGWQVTGTDVSEDAVRYVTDTLHFPAFVSRFPLPDPEGRLRAVPFQAVTLWFVIEHFDDLKPVFESLRGLVAEGGVLAFSTPAASGVSGFFSRRRFLQNSPIDHYTIWNRWSVRRQLARVGFSVARVVSTGHHPERFPGMARAKRGGLAWRLVFGLSRLLGLGDTFEVYAVKNGLREDAQ